ncbi:M48 family metalloprotease [Chryseobacterium sp.]|uniref:M48 family metalloprotease n=1 Tax=Chryseobacterium sp. TaxID=1871047 RepID=UPI0038900E91
MKKIYYLFFLLITHFALAQTYKPMDTADYRERKIFLQNYNINNDAFSKNIKSHYEGELSRHLNRNYDVFQKEFRKKVQSKDFHHKSQFNSYIQTLITKLNEKNASIPAKLIVLIEKDNTPNAASVGDGTLIVNMGLFNWLGNEDQMLAVLSHEIAHQILMHSLKYQTKKFEATKSSKSQVSEINRFATDAPEKALKLFKNIVYNNSEERRKNEKQADSLGYILFKNASNFPFEYQNALKNLQLFDTLSPKIVDKSFYEKTFNLPNAPFKENWMKMEDFSNYNYTHYNERYNKDSLSTHPEMEIRIARLAELNPELRINKPATKSENTVFTHLKEVARWEVAPNYFYAEEYGLGIYSLLQEKSNESLKDQNYFDTWLGKYFDKIYWARKEYKLNRYLERLEPQKQDKSYQQFLSFMWNLSLEDIKNIAEYYQKKSS